MSPPPPMRRPTDPVRETAPSAAGASSTEGRGRASTFVIAMVAAVFLALSGAFDTATAPLLKRLAFWVLAMGVGSAIGVVLTNWLERRNWLGSGPIAIVAIVSVAMAGPLILVVWLLSGWFLHQGFSPARLPSFAVPVLLVTAVVTTINILLDRSRSAITHAETLAPGQAAKPIRFLERIPRKLRGGDLLALQAEDHYLRLHTTIGSDLILMRLSDAIAELDGVEGAQTHRSWWVAKDAIDDVQKGDGRAVLKLKGGVEAPVSRTYAKALREAGWF